MKTPMSTPALLRAIQLGMGTLGRLSPAGAAHLGAYLAFRPQRHSPRPWEVEALGRARPVRLAGPRGFSAGHCWEPATEVRGTVLMLHGWEGRASQFGHLGPLLAGRGLRAIALDAPGHGQSPRGDGGPGEWIATLRLAAAEIGPLHGLVGHSLGSVASLLAIESGLSVPRLALIAPPVGVGPRMETAADRLGLEGAARSRFLTLTIERMVRGGGVADLTDRVAASAPPTLILHAPDDCDVPIDEGRRLARAMPDARFVTTDAIGHFKILRDPESLGIVERFLAADADGSTAVDRSLEQVV